MIPMKDDFILQGKQLNQLLLEGKARGEKLRAQQKAIKETYTQLRKDIEGLQERTNALTEASRLSKGDKNYVLKECSCGRKYHVEEWFELPFAGYQKSKFMDGEMRHCDCQSTLLFITERKNMGKGIDLLRFAVQLLDSNNNSMNDRFTAEELLRIANGVQKNEYGIYPDNWTERQLQECVQFGIIPKWKKVDTRKHTHYVPVYRNESENVIQVAVSWTATKTVSVYADTVADAIEWAESDMPTPKDGVYKNDTFNVDYDITADLNVLTLMKEDQD